MEEDLVLEVWENATEDHFRRGRSSGQTPSRRGRSSARAVGVVLVLERCRGWASCLLCVAIHCGR